MINTQTPGNAGNRAPKAAYQRKGVLRSDLIAIIVLLLFVAVVVMVDRLLKPALSGPLLLIVGVALALVPALLWLYMFYQLDQAEPEPVSDVTKIFVVGLALASAIGIPLTNQLFRVQDWLERDTTTRLLGSIFIIGSVEAFIVFATVRFFIYHQPEFDERADGVIYGTAAGLGYATALNLQFILSSGGAALGPAEIYVAEVALAHAALGGLLGYFLGKAKMQREPTGWLALGFGLAALLNGLFYVLRNSFETGSISVGANSELPSFAGVLLSGVAAIVMSALAAFLIRRDVRLTLEGRMPARSADADVGERQSTQWVLATFAVTLIIGALVWNGAVNGTTAFDKEGVRGAYPAYYTVSKVKGELLHVSDALGTGAEFSIVTTPGGGTVQDAATLLTVERAGKYAVYKVLDSAPATVNGKAALMQRFTAVDAGGLGRAAPQMRDGIDYILVNGGRSTVITLLAAPDKMQDVTPLFKRFVESLSL
jgi:RsiW-degrading membrane proteinase PrsW (M82 family)